MVISPSAYEHAGEYLDDTVDEDRIQTLCWILGNLRRQRVVCYLLQDTAWVETSHLARWITGIETDCKPSHAQGDTYRSVRTSLIQTHLDALADEDIIEYDGDREQLRRGPDFDDAAGALVTLASQST